MQFLSRPGPWFNIKMTSYRYRKSHCGDKTILRPSYLHNGISYTGKMTSLYWIRAQHIITNVCTCHGSTAVALCEHGLDHFIRICIKAKRNVHRISMDGEKSLVRFAPTTNHFCSHHRHVPFSISRSKTPVMKNPVYLWTINCIRPVWW